MPCGCCHCETCRCPRDYKQFPPERGKTFYRTKPYNWGVGSRTGTSWTIEECRTVATSRHQEDAEELVKKLNSVRRLELEVARLRDARGPSLTDMRAAMIAELADTPSLRWPPCRSWPSHRKAIAEFGRGVLKRLGREASIDD